MGDVGQVGRSVGEGNRILNFIYTNKLNGHQHRLSPDVRTASNREYHGTFQTHTPSDRLPHCRYFSSRLSSPYLLHIFMSFRFVSKNTTMEDSASYGNQLPSHKCR